MIPSCPAHVGSLLAVPLWVGACEAESFYASIGLLLGEYIVAECWFGPTIAALYSVRDARAAALSLAPEHRVDRR